MAGPATESPQPPSISSREYRGLLKDFETGQELLREAEFRFRQLVETIPGVAYIAEPGEHGAWHYISPRLDELLGYAAEQWIADPTAWIGLIHPEDREEVLEDEESWTETTGGVHVLEYRVRAHDGRYRWIRDAATARPGDQPGDKAVWFGVLSDVTDSREAEEALRHSEQLLRSVLETAQDAFIAVDRTGSVLDWNRRAETMFGRDRREVSGRGIAELIIPERFRESNPLGSRGPLAIGASHTAGTTIEMVAMRADGSEFPTEVTLWTTRSGDSVRCNAFIRDITERKQMERDLQALAFSDPLTGLPNRALFSDRLDQALASRDRVPQSVAVLFLDIDDFKTINDSLGHAAGDRLLRLVADRIGEIVRPSDTVARFAGDEFSLLLHRDAAPVDAVAIAERIRMALQAPFPLEGRRTVVSASIGVAFATMSPTSRADDLLRDADAAMYHAKRSGKNRSVVYDPVMHTQALARLDLKADLQQALDRDELSLVFQPYFVLAGGQLAGFEALIRWTHPVRGMVPPTEFIPLAEETGLIHPIGDWVLREACRQAALWRAADPGCPAPGINVNVSALQIQESGLTDQVNAALLASHLSPERLVLEITESVLLQKAARTVERLEDLRSLGVRIAIDDFGTGYSSLSYLQHLPIDILKIDKSFVDHVGRGQDDSSMASVVLQIGRTLRLQVVAEGVEERHQLQALRALGCDLAQGFLLGRPMGAAEAAALCESHRPDID
jgi:diguanylate cyclase (GGDEF)-like protein/PAS domain S-box-containing protein